MREVRLRRGAVTDADAVAHVHRLSRASYYGVRADSSDQRETLWSRLIAQPGRITHLAECAGGVIGFMSAFRAVATPSTLEMTALYVLPEHVGAGVGSRLHDRFEEERRADEDGLLEVWQGNDRAIDFYARRGWRATTTTRPGPQDSDYVTYRLPARGRS